MADPKGNDFMKRVDFSSDNISRDDMEFVQQMTKRHRELIGKRLRARYLKRNAAVGCLIAAAVVGVYGYSMFAVKQETFLDEFDTKDSKS